MEFSAELKFNIKDLQRGLTKAIQTHQLLHMKMKDHPSLETELLIQLNKIQKTIIDINAKQKVLIQKLRQEMEAQSNGTATYNFNLYKVKPDQLESKKRRRKDLRIAPKVVPQVASQSPPSLSPSPTPSSSSLSDSSLDFDDVTPSMMPIPLPRARPKLLPNTPTELYTSVSRRDLKSTRLRKPVKTYSDEEIMRDIPMYSDPPPSPEPTDESGLKSRYMSCLSLVPKDMLHEFLNKKVERKRRSTANNNPNFVYNNDWEIPVWKRSKTYLSPHKGVKMEMKKVKEENSPEPGCSKDNKDNRREDEAKTTNKSEGKSPQGSRAASRLDKTEKLDKGEKLEMKSGCSTPDSASSQATVCCVCRLGGDVNLCKECDLLHHAPCTPSAPCGKLAPFPAPEDTSEDSEKEEFASKCPNIAESYTKLKEYIKKHQDMDSATVYAERSSLKVELMLKNQELYGEKERLEERAAHLSEVLMNQEDSNSELQAAVKETLGKIQRIRDFVEIYQRTNRKAKEESSNDEKETPEPKPEEETPEARSETPEPMSETPEIEILDSPETPLEPELEFPESPELRTETPEPETVHDSDMEAHEADIGWREESPDHAHIYESNEVETQPTSESLVASGVSSGDEECDYFSN